MMDQRWLSLTGICTTLNISPDHAFRLVKQGYLEVIWGRPGRKNKDARFLDPTPAYAERLRLCETLYGRSNIEQFPVDFDIRGFLTVREVSELLGWTLMYTKKYLKTRKVPNVHIGQYVLYSMATVRDLMWRRSGRKQSTKQRAPFLIREMVDFFLAAKAAHEEEVPTDNQFAEDDLLQRKLVRMMKMKSPERELALKEFYDKVALAKDVVAACTAQTPAASSLDSGRTEGPSALHSSPRFDREPVASLPQAPTI
jgi:hypothetical protein